MRPTLQIAFHVDKMSRDDIRGHLDKVGDLVFRGLTSGVIRHGEIIGSWSISSTLTATERETP